MHRVMTGQSPARAYSARLAAALFMVVFMAAGVFVVPAVSGPAPDDAPAGGDDRANAASGPAESAGPEVELAEDLSVRQLGPGLWLHRSSTRLGGVSVHANGLIVTSPSGAMLIDTPWNDAQTTRLLDWIEEELGVPLLQLAVTHFHADRMGGIAAVQARGIPTYGSQLTAEMAVKNGLPPPVRTFEYQMALRVGTETVELFYPGPGHTADNIVAWLERSRVLFGGCLVKDAASAGLGYTGDANLTAWPQSLERVAERYPNPSLVVPGHGTPGGSALIRTTLELLAGGEPK